MSLSERTVVLFNPSSVRGVGERGAPPMGLLMAAVHLHGRYRVVLVDQRVEPHWERRLRRLLAERPVCLGVTALTGRQIANGLAASRMAQEAGCPVVWGGVHASLLPEATLAHPLVDHIVQGEGEETFAALVDALAAGASPQTVAAIPGVWTSVDGVAVFGGERPFVKLDELPPVPYDLVDLRRYFRRGLHGRSLVLFSSRGCPHRCTFCFNRSVHRGRWRAFPAERVLDDLRRLLATYPEIDHVEFWDDEFFVQLPRARAIAEGIHAAFPTKTWSVLGAHAHDVVRMDDDYLATLRASGLQSVLIGVESGSERMLTALRKGTTPDEVLRANRRLGAFGIHPTYSFMSGFPNETDDHVEETVSLIFQLRRENPAAVTGNVKPFVCYPGTMLHDAAVARGMTVPTDLEGWIDHVWQNYDRMDIPWASRKRRRFLVRLYYYTLLMNPHYMFIPTRSFAVLTKALLPLTEWRVRHLRFELPVEVWLVRAAERVARVVAR